MSSVRANFPRDPRDSSSRKPHLEAVERELQPVAMDTSRRSAHEIFEQAEQSARDELARPAKALAFSGVAGGMTMGLTGIAVSVVHTTLGNTPSSEFIAALFYPIGFIAVIIGRAQLFTENTLYPVVLVLSERRHLIATMRLWAIVFSSNVVGAALFALLVTHTSALAPKFQQELMRLGSTSASPSMAHIFWTGVIGGWMIALVAWMVTASHWTIGQIAVIWLLTFVVGLGRFAHCIATSGEVLAAAFGGAIPLFNYLRWIVPARRATSSAAS